MSLDNFPRRARAIAKLGLALLGTALAVSAGAQEPAKPAASNVPIGQKDVSASEIAETPMTDLNLKKGDIPPVLLRAKANPYRLNGMTSCTRLAGAVNALTAVLGDDLDITTEPENGPQAGRVAQSLVGSFIPFRGIIREVSGASAQQRRLQAAILAGYVRRGFLKGIGEQRGCLYPARSATPQSLSHPAPATKKSLPKH